MNTPDYKNVAGGIRQAISDMESWPEQDTVETVVGRIVTQLCAEFSVQDKDFNATAFRDLIYHPYEEDEDIPF